jgi:O-acetyl-ADP-ribose deacetylase (regulator of RNase III)
VVIGPPGATDSDGDGVTDANDACPAVAASTANGCPVKSVIALTASLGKLPKLKRSGLVKGISLPVRCGLDSKATATLTLSRAVAKKLKLALKKKQKTVAVGSGSVGCKAGKPGKLKLKLKSALARKVRKPRGAVTATLVVVFTRAGAKAVTVRRTVKLT